jgi:co-chaperonin GroES (HSP10)
MQKMSNSRNEAPEAARTMPEGFLAESLARGVVTAAAEFKGNTSGLVNMLEFRVLILPDAVQNITAGGVHIPEQSKAAEVRAVTRGVVVALSPGAFDYYKFENDYAPKIGDRVLFGKHVGLEVEGKDRQKYRIVSDKDVISKLDY